MNSSQGGGRKETVSSVVDGPVTDLHAKWIVQQWNRYDTLIAKYATQDNVTAKKALCLAFVRSVLDDKTTETILTEALFGATERMMTDCTVAIGGRNVRNTKALLLFALWLLPHRSWQQCLFKGFRDYWSRACARSPVPFRNALESVLRLLAASFVEPVAELLEPFL